MMPKTTSKSRTDMRNVEDAIQFFRAQRANAAVLITRNTADFPSRDMSLQTPRESLATHFAGA
jgi:hypothetical protein